MPKCKTRYCTNDTKGTRPLCSKCYPRQGRLRNPMLSCYLNLKHNCKRRKKYFALTFEEFEMLCVETNYLQGRGITKVSYTIDCIDNEAGYFLLNIRVIPKSENSKKGTKALVYDWQTGYATAIKLFEKVQMEREEDMPF